MHLDGVHEDGITHMLIILAFIHADSRLMETKSLLGEAEVYTVRPCSLYFGENALTWVGDNSV